MKKGIVITTSEHTQDWLLECLHSLPNPDIHSYPILIVSNGGYVPKKIPFGMRLVINDWNGFELGGIQRGAEHFDEFIHLMDTCVLKTKDPKALDALFKNPGGVGLCAGFFSYIGKYKTEVINRIGIPRIVTKEEAISFERDWNRQYIKNDPDYIQYDPELPIHTEVFEEKHGRKNMVLENDLLIKYKGTWSL